MKVSDITTSVVKNYLRVDFDTDDTLIEACIEASKKYAQDYTGLSDDDFEALTDMPLAILALTADLYEQRQATVSNGMMNPVVAQILGAHSITLI